MTWGAVTGATGYHVFRDTDAAPAGATGLGAQSSPYADTSATPGQLYYYWVVASNSTSSSTSDWSTANSGYRKLATVTGVAATENLSDKIRVTWTDIAGEPGYSIWRNTEDAPGSAAIVGTAAATAPRYDDTGSYTVSWTRGDGSYVLGVARQGAAPADPADSTVYAADAAFGSGDTTAAGSYVVYKGTGTNVTVTALSAGTEYTFAVYEFNGDHAELPDERRAGREPVHAGGGTDHAGVGHRHQFAGRGKYEWVHLDARQREQPPAGDEGGRAGGQLSGGRNGLYIAHELRIGIGNRHGQLCGLVWHRTAQPDQCADA